MGSNPTATARGRPRPSVKPTVADNAEERARNLSLLAVVTMKRLNRRRARPVCPT